MKKKWMGRGRDINDSLTTSGGNPIYHLHGTYLKTGLPDLNSTVQQVLQQITKIKNLTE